MVLVGHIIWIVSGVCMLNIEGSNLLLHKKWLSLFVV